MSSVLILLPLCGQNRSGASGIPVSHSDLCGASAVLHPTCDLPPCHCKRGVTALQLKDSLFVLAVQPDAPAAIRVHCAE